MMKRLFALLLAMVMLLGAVPMSAIPVQATEAEEIVVAPEVEEVPVEEETPVVEEAPVEEETPVEEEAPVEEVAVIEEPAVEETVPEEEFAVGHIVGNYADVEFPSNEDQFAGYVQQVFYGRASGSDSASYGTAAGKKLSGNEKILYNAIVPMFKNVAAGKQSAACVSIGQEITVNGRTLYPDVYADLSYYVDYYGDVSAYDQGEIFNMFIALLADLAYEQYWHDKTTGYTYTWYYNTSTGKVSRMEFYFDVADVYESSYSNDFYGIYYEANTSKTGAAAKAAANAKKIVSKHADKSDYNKLVAYKNELCSMVEYDYDAVNYGDFAWDNNPWQVINAFDGDSSTNIVCEGYAKSFMYLCELSDFNGKVTCYTVSGDAGGPHMWNIVTIGGKNYHTDITWIDGGAPGLFLAGGSGSPSTGYTFPAGRYVYDEDDKYLWGTGSDSILKLASSDYVPGPEAPTVSVTNVSSTGKIKLSWKAVDGAEEYKVYRSTSKSGTYKRLTTTSGTSLTNTSAKAGTQYYYYVVAVDGNGKESEKSNIVTRTCDLPRPELKISVVASTGKLKLSWGAIDGATEYELYRSTDGGKNYKLLKATTKTSLTHTGAVAGNKYYYKVKAIHSKSSANSAFSSAKYGTCDLPRPEVKISVVASTGKLKLRWDAIEGAVKYEVYRSTDGGETYKLLKTTTGTSLTNTSVTAGNKYYYKVKAIHSNSNANSAYSSVKYGTCDLARPTATVKLNNKGKPVVSWGEVAGAEKYIMYIYDADGNQLSSHSTTNLQLTHVGADKGVTYSYRVMAVHSNSAANSAKSTAVSITSK